MDLSEFGGATSKHVGDIWIAADSRISSPTNSGSRVVPTDAALKILPINLKLFQEYEYGPGSVPVYEGQLAFAFAGGVLPATMTYAMLVSYFRGLTGPYDVDLPTIGNIVGLVSRIGTTYAAETSQAFEAFLVGMCPLHHRNNKDHAYRLRFDTTGTPRNPELLDLMPDGSFALLGSNQAAIGRMIADGFAADLEYNPALAIKSVIEEEIAGDIGGYLHLGRIRGGVDIYPAWRGDSGSLPSPYADGKLGGLGEWRVNGIFGIA
ncbi:hypothetical protein [Sphingobium yanoikuyae]|nr:hypothetical protein [Sphingobium yanoikuyae]